MVRSDIFDNKINLQVFQFSNFTKNTKGSGLNLGLRYDITGTGLLVEVNTNIRYDHIGYNINSITYTRESEVKKILFDPFIGVNKEFKLLNRAVIYAQIGYSIFNMGTKFDAVSFNGYIRPFSLSYSPVSIGFGLIKRNFYVEPKIYFVPKGDFPYGHSQHHLITSIKAGFMFPLH
jgi:hypothetical protein